MAHPDPRLRKRNAMVIPGGLLALYAFLAMIYASVWRPDTLDPCFNGARIHVFGACYQVATFALPLLVIGIILVVVGLWVFRGPERTMEAHLYHGTGAHFTMALLISFVALPLLAVIVQAYRQSAAGVTYVMEVGTGRFQQVFLLEVLTLVALALFLPFLGLYVATSLHRRRFLRDAMQELEEGAQEKGILETEGVPEEPGWVADQYEPVSLPLEDALEPGFPEAGPEEEPAWPEAREEEPVWEEEWPTEEEAVEAPAWVAEDPEPVPVSEPASPEPVSDPASPVPVSEPASPEPVSEPMSMEPGDAAAKVDCLAHNKDGQSCRNPVKDGHRFCGIHECEAITRSRHEKCRNRKRGGTRFCAEHGCHGVTADGGPCKNASLKGSDYCRVHAG